MHAQVHALCMRGEQISFRVADAMQGTHDVEHAMRRLLHAACRGQLLSDQLPVHLPVCSGGDVYGLGSSGHAPSYELALKMYCDDPSVRDRLHAQFASRAALLLTRVQEAVAKGDLRRASLDAHSLRGMALYIGSPPVMQAATALENASLSENVEAVARQAARIADEVALLKRVQVSATAPAAASTLISRRQKLV